jgi:hypothetical protein
MTIVRTNHKGCVTKEQAEVRMREVVLLFDPDKGEAFLEYDCPSCDRHVVRWCPDNSTLEILHGARATKLAWKRPEDHLEFAGKPPITYDDLLRFHNEIEASPTAEGRES